MAGRGNASATLGSTPFDLLFVKRPAFGFFSRIFSARTLSTMSPEAALMILAAWVWLATGVPLISSTMSPFTKWSSSTLPEMDPGCTFPIRGWPSSPS